MELETTPTEDDLSAKTILPNHQLPTNIILHTEKIKSRILPPA